MSANTPVLVDTPFSYRTPDDSNSDYLVQLAGDFSNWTPIQLKEDASERGLFSGSVKLSGGKTYSYKFIVNGKWVLSSDDGEHPIGKFTLHYLTKPHPQTRDLVCHGHSCNHKKVGLICWHFNI